MKWFKNHKNFCIIFVSLIIFIPIIMHFVIFENSFPSKVSNDGWADFFGGYIGSIIGALATIIAISIEIEHNKSERYKEEVKSIRPYLNISNFVPVHNGNNLEITLTIENLGFQAACEVRIIENDQDDFEEKIIYNKYFAVAPNKEKEIVVTVNLNKTEDYFFEFYDIGYNLYRQEFRTSCKEVHGIKLPERYIILKPEIIQTKKERDKKFGRITKEIDE